MRIWMGILMVFGSLTASCRTFTVMVYNVENLFDVDDVAVFSDYGPDAYGPGELATKLENIAEIVAQAAGTTGPDVILFQEFEADQTPDRHAFDAAGFLRRYRERTILEWLEDGPDRALRDLPVEAFLLKHFEDVGMGPYHVVVGEVRPDPTGRKIAHTNVVFSRFPILSTHTHQTIGARGILEVQVDVEGASVIFFNNHWKSGASNPDTEVVRVGNATVLRERLDEILDENPLADIVIGGDLNAHHDHYLRHPEMIPNGINTILRARGNEAELLGSQGADLYNLWYELPPWNRGSDVYRNRWGTLMHLIITRGLYERAGVTYVDGSFRVMAVSGRNTHAESGVPVRWQFAGDAGYGYSDHLPLVARFRLSEADVTSDWVGLTAPGQESGTAVIRLALQGEMAVIPDAGVPLQRASNLGRFVRLRVVVLALDPLKVRRGEEVFPVWIPNRELRRIVLTDWTPGSTVTLNATVGMHKGQWQLVIEDPDWVAESSLRH